MLQINNLADRIVARKDDIQTAVQRVLTRGWLVLGPEVKQFEQSFAEYLGAGDCVGVANGTDAIELALKALGVGPGDLVATVANAGMYTTTSILAIGARPYFMDVDMKTRGASLQGVVQAVAAGAKCVVVTHLYGQAIPEIAAMQEHCTRQGVPLLEDCAQAHGARVDGKCVGSFGAAASFSFYPTKNLGALGDGGAVATSDPAVAQRVRELRQYGWTSKYCVEIPGARNSRLDELQAAVLSVFLPRLDEDNARRREIATRYSREITHPLVLTPETGGADYVAHLYIVRSPQRDALREHLRASGVGTDIHYPIPDYRQPLLSGRYGETRLPNTELLAAEVLTLPCYPEMTEQQVEMVVAAVQGWSA